MLSRILKDWTMPMLFYTLALSLLLTHEIDAALAREWQLLYVLRSLPQPSAAAWFIAVHVPMFMGILWFSYQASTRIAKPFRLGLALFIVVHAGLHYRLSSDPAYLFEGWLSNSLILGSALAALVYLAANIKRPNHSLRS